jgi:tetratricopeptide (TPR) repeat protein
MLSNQIVKATDADFFFQRAKAYVGIHEFEQAIEDFNVAEKLIRTSSQTLLINYVHSSRAGCYSQAHQFDNAIADLAKLNFNHPIVIESLLRHNLYEILEYAQRPDCPDAFLNEVIRQVTELLGSHTIDSKQLLIKPPPHILGIFRFFIEFIRQKSLRLEKNDKLTILSGAVQLRVSHEIVTALEQAKSEAAKHRIKILEKELDTCEEDEKKKICLNLAKLCYDEKQYDDVILYCNFALIILGYNPWDGFLYYRAFANLKNNNYENAIADFTAMLDMKDYYDYLWAKNLPSFHVYTKYNPEQLSAIAHYHRSIAYFYLGNSADANLKLIEFMQREYEFCSDVFNEFFPHSIVEHALDPLCPAKLFELVQERFIKMALVCNGISEKDEATRKICNFYLSLLAKRSELFANSVDVYRIILRKAKLKIPELYEKTQTTMKEDSYSSINTSKSFSQADIFSQLQIKPQPSSEAKVEEELFTSEMLESDEQGLIVDVNFSSQVEETLKSQRSAFSFMN